MGVCVKLASQLYTTGEIVFYRGLVGATFIALMARWRGGSLRTTVPGMHLWRSLTGVCALCLWFYALGHLPLATAVTLNYMSSVWMALFLIGGAVALGARGTKIDGRLVATVLVGFLGVALVLRPTLTHNQAWAGVIGLLSGMLSATAYLQVTALGRVGEPEYRVVFYFSLGSMSAGLLWMAWNGLSAHSWRGAGLLAATGLLATLGQITMTRAYAIGRTLSNASLQYLGIVFSFLYGVWLFDDPVTLPALAGMAMIVGAGLAATRLRAQSAAPDSTLTASDT
jgi:S-adenosylmethionine uptake transporter